MPPMFKLTYKVKNDRTTTCWMCKDYGRVDALGTSGVEGSADAG